MLIPQLYLTIFKDKFVSFQCTTRISLLQVVNAAQNQRSALRQDDVLTCSFITIGVLYEVRKECLMWRLRPTIRPSVCDAVSTTKPFVRFS
jgi:hypothetical protein